MMRVNVAVSMVAELRSGPDTSDTIDSLLMGRRGALSPRSLGGQLDLQKLVDADGIRCG